LLNLQPRIIFDSGWIAILDLSDEEISELYCYCWDIENLWKFLRMHLSLDQLITKNINVVMTQIYMVLIAYLILELIEVHFSMVVQC